MAMVILDNYDDKRGLFADAPVTIGYRGYESSEWVAMFP